MASKIYPNNACCYYVSWDNLPLTGSLFILENLIFIIMWTYDIQTLTLLSNLFILYIAFSAFSKILTGKNSLCCSSCNDCSSCYAKYFELIYDKVNSGCDWLRKSSKGTKVFELVLCLYLLKAINLSLFGLSWIIGLWSFIKPALFKFLGLNLCELCESFKENNPIKEKLLEIYKIIPRASSVSKNQ